MTDTMQGHCLCGAVEITADFPEGLASAGREAGSPKSD